MDLFHRAGNHLYPLPAAFWLFQQAISLLHRESFARSMLALPDGGYKWLRVRLNLSFSMGLFTKAVSTTIEEMRRARSRILVDFVFVGVDEIASPHALAHHDLARLMEILLLWKFDARGSRDIPYADIAYLAKQINETPRNGAAV